MKKLDVEALTFLFILNMKEEKNKKYSKSENCDEHKAYVFNDYEEFKDYFINNGIISIYDDSLLQLCIMKQTKKGTIISMKKLCDHTIEKCAQTRLNNAIKELTQEKIDEIHSRGKITMFEKVAEWESFDLCAPGDYIGSAAYRCHTFNNCHECLLDYASSSIEYDKMDFKLILPFDKEEKVKEFSKTKNNIL